MRACLAPWQTLASLELCHNPIGDAGCIAITQSFQVCACSIAVKWVWTGLTGYLRSPDLEAWGYLDRWWSRGGNFVNDFTTTHDRRSVTAHIPRLIFQCDRRPGDVCWNKWVDSVHSWTRVQHRLLQLSVHCTRLPSLGFGWRELIFRIRVTALLAWLSRRILTEAWIPGAQLLVTAMKHTILSRSLSLHECLMTEQSVLQMVLHTHKHHCERKGVWHWCTADEGFACDTEFWHETMAFLLSPKVRY